MPKSSLFSSLPVFYDIQISLTLYYLRCLLPYPDRGKRILPLCCITFITPINHPSFVFCCPTYHQNLQSHLPNQADHSSFNVLLTKLRSYIHIIPMCRTVVVVTPLKHFG